MSDVMLLGVLRMPMPDKPDAMTLHQFVGRARQAADRIEADRAEVERLRAALEVSQAASLAAVSKAQWQAVSNAELNALCAERVGFRSIVQRLVAGIDHLDKLTREWEPDHSSGADRRGWMLAKDARDEAARLLGPNVSYTHDLSDNLGSGEATNRSTDAAGTPPSI